VRPGTQLLRAREVKLSVPPEYLTASVSLPRLITGEVEEGLIVDEVEVE
jgi:hypothetical protein